MTRLIIARRDKRLIARPRMTIHVLLDTTAYRADPKRQKAGFHVLSQLAQSGKVQVHLPELVRLEFLSQEQEGLQGAIDDVERALYALTRRLADVPGLDKTRKEIIELKDASFAELTGRFEKWIRDCQVKVGRVEAHHGPGVVRAYFDGAAPFSRVKNRDDFPDAFIFQAILDTAKSVGQLLVVTNDTNLGAAVAKVHGIEAFSTLNDLLVHEAVAKASRELKSQEHLKLLRDNLPSYSEEIKQVLSNLLMNNLKYRRIYDPHFRNEDQAAEISEIEGLHDLQFDPVDVEVLGADTLLVSFRCTVGAVAIYSMTIAEYESLDDYENDGLSVFEEENAPRGYLEASEQVSLSVDGRFAVTPVFKGELEIKDPSEDFTLAMINADYSLEEVDEVEVIDEPK